MDHIKNVRNYRALPHAHRRADGVNPLCGDQFTVYLRLAGERIEEASFQCSCCGISMASASVMTQSVRGRSLAEASTMVQQFFQLIRADAHEASATGDRDWRAILAVVRASPSRANCAVLAWHTLSAALEGRESTTL